MLAEGRVLENNDLPKMGVGMVGAPFWKMGVGMVGRARAAKTKMVGENRNGVANARARFLRVREKWSAARGRRKRKWSARNEMGCKRPNAYTLSFGFLLTRNAPRLYVCPSIMFRQRPIATWGARFARWVGEREARRGEPGDRW